MKVQSDENGNNLSFIFSLCSGCAENERESERVPYKRECRRATHKLPVANERAKERANYARHLAFKCFNKFWMLKVMNASTK